MAAEKQARARQSATHTAEARLADSLRELRESVSLLGDRITANSAANGRDADTVGDLVSQLNREQALRREAAAQLARVADTLETLAEAGASR